jgi:hypothetical protein
MARPPQTPPRRGFRPRKIEKSFGFFVSLCKFIFMEAIEKNIEFDEQGNSLIHLGKNFSKRKAKIVVLFEDEGTTDAEWLKLAMKGGAFDFLNDPSEDIYSPEDGVAYQRKEK